MATTINIPFPVWAGMVVVDGIGKILSSYKKELTIPCGHPKSIEIKERPCDEGPHVVIKYWYPMQGYIKIGLIGHEEYYGIRWDAVSLRATWRGQYVRKRIQLGREDMEILIQLLCLKKEMEYFGYCPDNFQEVENRAKIVIYELQIC